MTGNKKLNMKLQDMFLNLCIGIIIIMLGVIIWNLS
jgi:hypothetical protein